MPGLVLGIYVSLSASEKGVDGRDIGERSDVVLRTAIGERSDAVLRTAIGERSDAVLRTAIGERSDAVLRTAIGERSDAVLRTAMPGHDEPRSLLLQRPLRQPDRPAHDLLLELVVGDLVL